MATISMVSENLVMMRMMMMMFKSVPASASAVCCMPANYNVERLACMDVV